MRSKELEKNLLQHQNTSEEEEEPLRKRVWEESKKLWIVAGPAMFTRFSTFGIMIVTQSFIGYIGSTELAAYSLVMTVLVRFANGILVSQYICSQGQLFKILLFVISCNYYFWCSHQCRCFILTNRIVIKFKYYRCDLNHSYTIDIKTVMSQT